jgi:hypothetical protein
MHLPDGRRAVVSERVRTLDARVDGRGFVLQRHEPKEVSVEGGAAATLPQHRSLPLPAVVAPVALWLLVWATSRRRR